MKYYIFVMLDNIKEFFFILAILPFIVAVVSGVQYEDENNQKKTDRLKCRIIVCAIFFITVLMCGIFIPSTKQAAAIYLLPKIVENKGLQEMPDKIVNLGNEWLEELRPKKEEGR